MFRGNMYSMPEIKNIYTEKGYKEKFKFSKNKQNYFFLILLSTATKKKYYSKYHKNKISK
jgi:hypothetical protein